MCSMKRWLAMAGIMALGLPSMATIIWPLESDWNPVYQGADFYNDVEGDKNPAPVDLIGTTNTYSAGYWGFVPGGMTMARRKRMPL